MSKRVNFKGGEMGMGKLMGGEEEGTGCKMGDLTGSRQEGWRGRVCVRICIAKDKIAFA